MSERPAQRGRGGGRGGGGGGGGFRGGRGGGGGRGGAGAGRSEGGAAGDREKSKKENILDLAKYMDKQITVKFNGGREGEPDPENPAHLDFRGTLKGYDALMNLVLDDVQEVMRDDEGNESTRSLGLVVARGTLLVLVSPVDGSEEIANPFAQNGDD
ncbi:hypothetical protein S40285_07508 [Stachybotrys chlorohalonatus IBT 40285]|uniref:Sm domain-containing protein n=1 Tax=Stachybotrys chlorohalonatus (strain IBT 40285) TaxID=1283841 RepID=A0A084QGI1_STAC4|nr:hypothetical protein S40285_07508 [Stachybotrys chlorohalonata IBT 40285]